MTITRHRGSRAFRSEREAWEDVREAAHAIQRAAREVTDRYRMQTQVGKIVDNLVDLSLTMQRQVEAGHHENPPLSVFAVANPPRVGTIISEHLYTIEYRHQHNGKDYYHNFRRGTEMRAMPDGSISIRRPGAKVWADLPE